METVLVTGGAGFIGSAFVRYLYDKYPDYRIIVLDCLTYAGDIENFPEPSWREHNDRFVFWYGDITNGELVDTLIAQSDMVVHFAAETHVTRSIYDNVKFFMTDVIGTQTLCNAVCKYKDKVRRFIHISTSEVYGTALSGRIDEEHPLKPMSPYASAKCGADRLVYSYWATYKIPAVIVRPFNNYGPRQHLEKVIPRFITCALLDEPLRVHGDGQAARDFVYVEDNCRAIDLILHAKEEQVVGEVFNVGSDHHRTILEVAQDVLRVMGKPAAGRLSFIGNRPGQVVRHTSNSDKIKQTLGWKQEMDWETGLRTTVRWYEENDAQWRKQMWMREIPIITETNKRELH